MNTITISLTRGLFGDKVKELCKVSDENNTVSLKELTTKYNGKGIDYFSQLFKEELSKNDVMVQLDFLTSYRLIEICSQEDIDRFNLRYGNRKSRHLIPRYYYKRTVLGDNLYLFISKGIV